jgi:hypothetical protein
MVSVNERLLSAKHLEISTFGVQDDSTTKRTDNASVHAPSIDSDKPRVYLYGLTNHIDFMIQERRREQREKKEEGMALIVAAQDVASKRTSMVLYEAATPAIEIDTKERKEPSHNLFEGNSWSMHSVLFHLFLP